MMSSTARSNFPSEDTGRVKIRNRELNYKHLNGFNSKTCSVVNIEMPDIDQAVTHSVSFTDDKSTYQYHGTELKQIVKFKAVYMPLDNNEGLKLLKAAKDLVEDVLKDGYEPATATITQKGKEGKIVAEKSIADCMITGAEIEIDVNDYVRITFDLEGLDQPKKKK